MFDIEEPVQQLIRSYTTSHQARIMGHAFSLASQNPFPTLEKWVALSSALVPLFNTLTTPILRRQSITKIEPGSRILVGFSGGKDSTAVAIKIKKAGGTPILFYVKGVNKAYPGEEAAARNVADALGVQLITHQVDVKGKSDYVENPVKNQYILSLMVDAGLKMGVTEFAQGNLLCDTVSEYNISYGFSDCHEMYQAVEPIMVADMPDFKFHYLLEDDSDSLTTIIENEPHILPLVQSCMTPIRYRGGLHKNNMKKYGVELMDNRCGSCYKCAIEWLHVAKHTGNTDAAFASHSIDMMVRGLERVLGKTVTRAESIPQFFSGDLVKFVQRYL